MINPIYFENENFLIHSFRPVDLNRISQLSIEVFNILSDDTLHFIPTKRLQNVQESKAFILEMILNFHSGRNYLHFITDKLSGKVVGMIDLISPALAMEHYQIPCYPFFIEFYLGSFASGCYLMTELLPVVVDKLLAQGIGSIGAVVNKENIAAKKVLKKARFSRKYHFDTQQDFYEVVAA
jgi:RimJ/RimL family protein N-acetyltransferase